jgi:putative membrane protein
MEVTMKLTGLSALACVAIVSIACDARDNSRYEESTATIAERDVEVTGTSGQAARAGAELFAERAMMANKAEIKLGELAGENAQSAAVKDFARMMVRDHGNGLNSLKEAVKGFNVDEPAQLDAKHQELYDRLSKLNGAEFDREYMKAMVDGHREVVDMLDDRAGQGPSATGTSGADNSRLDASVNQWAAKALPTTKTHLQKAEQVNSGLK